MSVPSRRVRWAAYAVAALYALALIKLLFWRTPMFYDVRWTDALTNWDYPLANLTPLNTIESYLFHRDRYNFDTWFKVFFGNLFLFFPFGILVPLLLPRFRRFLPFMAALLVVLPGVELLQKATLTGAFDVDDIILNGIGGIIGYVVGRAAWRVGRRPAGR